MKAAKVELERVTKLYGAHRAVDAVSFTIEPGTLVTLLGPSGCGKTTTLRMIAGLEIASEGRIRIGDVDVTKVPATERDVTMVFQSYALFPHMSVRENVAYGLLSSGRSKKEALAKAEEGLRLVGLDHAGDRLPNALSGGQQQRVAVARALVLEPSVLLLDEPLSNLDARLRRKMREDIREIQQRLGVTAVYVTHDQAEALSVSDAIIVMEKGQIAQFGSPRELYEAPRSSFIAGFMGEANLLRGVLRSGVLELDGGVRIEVAQPGLPDGAVEAAVRPQAVRIAKKNGGAAGARIAGRIVKATYLGSHMEYTLETAAGELFAIAYDAKAPFQANDEIEISFDSSGVAIVRS